MKYALSVAFLLAASSAAPACGLIGMLFGPCSAAAVEQQAKDFCTLHGVQGAQFDACVRLATAEIQKGNEAEFAQRLQNAGAAMQSAGAAMQQIQPQMPAPPQHVTCVRQGAFVNCNSF